MPRPVKCRKIGFLPDSLSFKPAGIPGRELEEITLTLDEMEAVRLADREGLYQEEAAKHMNISRQTFGNILLSAHQKIAEFLIDGKMLTIEGGNITMEKRHFSCDDCQHTWSLNFGSGRPSQCPQCQSMDIHREKSGHKEETEKNHAHGQRKRHCRKTGKKAVNP